MKKHRLLLAYVLLLASFVSMSTISASADPPSLEESLYDLSQKYGFVVEYIESENAQQDYRTTYFPVASFDTVEQFANAIETGDFWLPTIDTSSPLPIEMASRDMDYEGNLSMRAYGSGNRNLGNITTGLDLCATISYTYNTVNSKRYYTSFTDFVPYFSGVNIGYHFDLTTWSGTVCSDVYYSDGQWHYTPASSGRGYYITWGGNISWGVEINGTLIGLSDYMGNWFIGMGDFSNT